MDLSLVDRRKGSPRWHSLPVPGWISSGPAARRGHLRAEQSHPRARHGLETPPRARRRRRGRTRHGRSEPRQILRAVDGHRAEPRHCALARADRQRGDQRRTRPKKPAREPPRHGRAAHPHAPGDAAALHRFIPGTIVASTGHHLIPCDNTVVLSLTIGGVSWPIDPRDLVNAPVPAPPQFGLQRHCFSSVQASPSRQPGEWLVGSTFLKNVYMKLDATENTIGFARLR
ncbi:hypothetical protein DENSPDRAFT_263001 [Dentipellis sp. KUC8613]|nr:hypothetical protein DENSPDRAFT_263001 [Dentipellis sp. KUC8613]